MAVGSARNDFEGLRSAREDLAVGATGLAPDNLEGADSVSDDLAAAAGAGGFDDLECQVGGVARARPGRAVVFQLANKMKGCFTYPAALELLEQ